MSYKDMNIISIDPSTNTGIFVYTPKGQKSFTAAFKEKDRLKRLGDVLRYFTKVVQSRKWDLLIIEGYSFGSRSQAVTGQAEIGGIIRGLFSAFNIPLLEIQIPTWKSVTGIKLKKNLKGEKENYLQTFKTFSNFFKEQIDNKKIVFNPHNPDEVDAILFFYTAIVLSRGIVLLNSNLKTYENIKGFNL